MRLGAFALLLLLLTHLIKAFVTPQMVVMVMEPTTATLGSAPGFELVVVGGNVEEEWRG